MSFGVTLAVKLKTMNGFYPKATLQVLYAAAYSSFMVCLKGTVELPDHIKFLQEAARQSGVIDLKLVAIYGSSYGRYSEITTT